MPFAGAKWKGRAPSSSPRAAGGVENDPVVNLLYLLAAVWRWLSSTAFWALVSSSIKWMLEFCQSNKAAQRIDEMIHMTEI